MKKKKEENKEEVMKRKQFCLYGKGTTGMPNGWVKRKKKIWTRG